MLTSSNFSILGIHSSNLLRPTVVKTQDTSLGNFFGSCLLTGQKLLPGQYIFSNSKSSVVEFTTNGDLCQYTIASTPYELGYQNSQYWTKKWCLGTSNSYPAYLQVSTTGNMQMVSSAGISYWQSSQSSTANQAFLKLQDDDNLVLFSDATNLVPVWACGGGGPFDYYDYSTYHAMSPNGKCYITGVTTTPDSTCTTISTTPMTAYIGDCTTMFSNLLVGEYIVNQAKTKLLQYQSNGDLCIYDLPTTNTESVQTTNVNWRLTWCLGVTNTNPYILRIDRVNGRFQLEDTIGYAYWQSGNIDTRNTFNYYLTLQNDGNLVLYFENPTTGVSGSQWACGGGGPFNFYKNSIYYSQTSYTCPLSSGIVTTSTCSVNYGDTSDSDSGSNSLSSSIIIVIVVVGIVCIIGFCCLFYRYNDRKKADSNPGNSTSLSPSMAATTGSTILPSAPTMPEVPSTMPNVPPPLTNYQPVTTVPSTIVPYQPIPIKSVTYSNSSDTPVVYAVAVPRSSGNYELVSTNRRGKDYDVVEAYAL